LRSRLLTYSRRFLVSSFFTMEIARQRIDGGLILARKHTAV
jgi:hypothetical protein